MVHSVVIVVVRYVDVVLAAQFVCSGGGSEGSEGATVKNAAGEATTHSMAAMTKECLYMYVFVYVQRWMHVCSRDDGGARSFQEFRRSNPDLLFVVFVETLS